jgi:hypothetical protein
LNQRETRWNEWPQRLRGEHALRQAIRIVTSTALYPTIFDALTGVLLEACVTLDQINTDYVVAGGWGPFLGPAHPKKYHPGTADVDVLFNDGDPQRMLDAVKALLAAGYTPSAKHPFQLLKKLDVAAEAFVFNIDLMHPKEGKLDSGLFQDILDLGTRTNYRTLDVAKIKSVAFPSAKIIFDERLWWHAPVKGTLPTGVRITHSVRVIDGAALVLSKCDSVSKPKRDRDAFDIWYVLTGPDGAQVSTKLKDLSRFPQIRKQLNTLRTFLNTIDNDFSDRVNRIVGVVTTPDPAQDVLAGLP